MIIVIEMQTRHNGMQRDVWKFLILNKHSKNKKLYEEIQQKIRANISPLW